MLENKPISLPVKKLVEGIKVSRPDNFMRLFDSSLYIPEIDIAGVVGYISAMDCSDNIQKLELEAFQDELNYLKLSLGYKPEKAYYYVVLRLREILYKE